MLTEMSVAGLAVDPSSGAPVVLLRDKSGELSVPIWIGQTEALSIAAELEGVKPPRPMTHDLLALMVRATGYQVKRIAVTELKESTFFAVITLTGVDRQLELDSRPSDAIALALRTKAPIFVSQGVIDRLREEERRAKIQGPLAGQGPREIFQGGKDDDKWDELLKSMKPEDFGKYRH